jgi:hypothetical protein
VYFIKKYLAQPAWVAHFLIQLQKFLVAIIALIHPKPHAEIRRK